jgi:excisionase family DNA binding protein
MKQGGLQATVFIEPKVLPSVCDKECSGLPSLCFYRPFRNVATRLHRLNFRVGGAVSHYSLRVEGWPRLSSDTKTKWSHVMKVFTTGQVAKICKVAPRTVSKWFDSGRLKGYRIPGSQDRRIPREYLIKFLKEHGMPLGDLEDEAMAKVLLVGQDQLLIENLKRHLPVENSFKIQVAASGFEAGIQAESFHPDCIVVDYAIGRIDAQQICQNLRRNAEYSDTIVIALLPDDGSQITVDRNHVNESFKKPFDVALLAERLRTLIGSRKELV